jgi:hypothetical protein
VTLDNPAGPKCGEEALNMSAHLGLYLVFKRLKHKSLLGCKASHSHVATCDRRR